MMKSTLNCFKKEKYLNEWLTKHHIKAIYFIDKLLAHKVKLDQININDWNCNTNPSVYVGKKQYSRLATSDWKLALKSLNK